MARNIFTSTPSFLNDSNMAVGRGTERSNRKPEDFDSGSVMSDDNTDGEGSFNREDSVGLFQVSPI